MYRNYRLEAAALAEVIGSTLSHSAQVFYYDQCCGFKKIPAMNCFYDAIRSTVPLAEDVYGCGRIDVNAVGTCYVLNHLLSQCPRRIRYSLAFGWKTAFLRILEASCEVTLITFAFVQFHAIHCF